MTEVRKLMNELNSLDGIMGSGIVSRDGRAVDMRFPGEFNLETISIMVATVFGAASTLHSEAGKNEPSHISIRSDECETLIFECGKRALIIITCQECDMARVRDIVLRLGQEFAITATRS